MRIVIFIKGRGRYVSGIGWDPTPVEGGSVVVLMVGRVALALSLPHCAVLIALGVLVIRVIWGLMS